MDNISIQTFLTSAKDTPQGNRDFEDKTMNITRWVDTRIYLRQLKQNNSQSWFIGTPPSSPPPQMAPKVFSLNFCLKIVQFSLKQLQLRREASVWKSKEMLWCRFSKVKMESLSPFLWPHWVSSTLLYTTPLQQHSDLHSSINSVPTNNLKCNAGKIEEQKRLTSSKIFLPNYYYLSTGAKPPSTQVSSALLHLQLSSEKSFFVHRDIICKYTLPLWLHETVNIFR